MTDPEAIASYLKGRKLVVAFRVPSPGKPRGLYMEDVHVVQSVRRLLPAEGSRKVPILQFYAVDGGQRTVEVPDILAVL